MTFPYVRSYTASNASCNNSNKCCSKYNISIHFFVIKRTVSKCFYILIQALLLTFNAQYHWVKQSQIISLCNTIYSIFCLYFIQVSGATFNTFQCYDHIGFRMLLSQRWLHFCLIFLFSPPRFHASDKLCE